MRVVTIDELMRLAVEVSRRSVGEDAGKHPLVGAVLADDSGEVLLTAHRGEGGPGQHAEYCLFEKAKAEHIETLGKTLFVTLEPCTSRGDGKIPCAQRVVDAGVSAVYLGMLDPNPVICGRGETFLRSNLRLERFPHELVREIADLNEEFSAPMRAELLPDSSIYVQRQVSTLMVEYLQRKGLAVDRLPSEWDVVVDDLVNYCSSAERTSRGLEPAYLVREARRVAFDKKYADYDYSRDARGLTDYWPEEVRSVLDVLKVGDLANYSVLDVGIGNGLEGELLLAECGSLTTVDAGPKSVALARRRLPHAQSLVGEAESLDAIPTGSQDIYLSFRTYQSSYFDVGKAVREAYRVTRPGGLVLISVANGYLGEDSVLVPGLVWPNTARVDRDRPYVVVDDIRKRLTLLAFQEVGVRTGFGEVYVYGRRQA